MKQLHKLASILVVLLLVTQAVFAQTELRSGRETATPYTTCPKVIYAGGMYVGDFYAWKIEAWHSWAWDFQLWHPALEATDISSSQSDNTMKLRVEFIVHYERIPGGTAKEKKSFSCSFP